jgi:glycosyltransferase involved in cell wall biosynthesis
MPFAGGAADAAAATQALERISLHDGDELLLIDNNPSAVATPTGTVRVVHATAERSSYSARNAGAAAARNEWLLFIDADTLPDAQILDTYFEPAPAETDGALAGEVTAAPGRDSLLVRYARARGYLEQRALLEDPFRPHAVTANLLVRRRAWESVGGFAEGARSGGDSDFSWRLQDAGWQLSGRPGAIVEHRHRESLRAFLRVVGRYAAGRAWLRRRWPGAFPGHPGVGGALKSAASAGRWLLTGELERGAFRTLDAAVGLTDALGEQLANRPPGAAGGAAGEAEVIIFLDSYPAISETFVVQEIRALKRAGHAVRVEAARRPLRQALGALHLAPVSYAEDDSRLEKLAAAAWLLAWDPAGCLRDLRDRRRWAAQEHVLPLREIAPAVRRAAAQPGARLYCHFAGGAALTTMRTERLLGRGWALTAHAYDIFRDVHNLPEKLESARVVLTGCEYNVEHLRTLVSAPAAERIHEIVMGIDAGTFRRRTPLPGGRRVIGVGRLVEKKGFWDLVAAVARLRASDVEELVLVGDGPLRPELQAQAQRLGVEDRVHFTGAVAPEQVREWLESADVLAMPCVIGADGDRDSMPVVVKEALALELMVVGTAEVGLPELIRPEFGRLVAPGDPEALAGALSQLLALGVEERAAAGRAGRAHVIEHCNVETETAKLAVLLGLQSTSIR